MYNKLMKKILQNILILSVFLTMPALVMAESAPVVAPVEQPSLLVRKQKTSADLRLVISKMNLYVARTQSAIDLLSKKDIDLTDAEDNLTSTSKFLLEAKTNLDKFSKIQISEENPTKSEAGMKYVLKKIEDNLKDARTHLLQSLSDLKEKIEESIQTNSDSTI